jgi:hypothetical protein
MGKGRGPRRRGKSRASSRELQRPGSLPPPPIAPMQPAQAAPFASAKRMQSKFSATAKRVFKIGAWIIGSLSTIAVIAEFIGPFWPAALIIERTQASADNPFSIPFSIKNPSSVFVAEEVIVSCYIPMVETSSATFYYNLIKNDPITILPNGTAQTNCNLTNYPGIRRAVINIVVTRKTFWPFSNREIAGPFAWHPELKTWLLHSPAPIPKK